MGLDCSHDAFSGAYSAFNRLRQFVAKAAGGSFPDHEDTGLDNEFFYLDTNKWPGIAIFLAHSDCEGEIAPDDCLLVAQDLTRILDTTEDGPSVGHIAAQGGFLACIKKFRDGCIAANDANEPLQFY